MFVFVQQMALQRERHRDKKQTPTILRLSRSRFLHSSIDSACRRPRKQPAAAAAIVVGERRTQRKRRENESAHAPFLVAAAAAAKRSTSSNARLTPITLQTIDRVRQAARSCRLAACATRYGERRDALSTRTCCNELKLQKAAMPPQRGADDLDAIELRPPSLFNKLTRDGGGEGDDAADDQDSTAATTPADGDFAVIAEHLSRARAALERHERISRSTRRLALASFIVGIIGALAIVAYVFGSQHRECKPSALNVPQHKAAGLPEQSTITSLNEQNPYIMLDDEESDITNHPFIVSRRERRHLLKPIFAAAASLNEFQAHDARFAHQFYKPKLTANGGRRSYRVFLPPK